MNVDIDWHQVRRILIFFFHIYFLSNGKLTIFFRRARIVSSTYASTTKTRVK